MSRQKFEKNDPRGKYFADVKIIQLISKSKSLLAEKSIAKGVPISDIAFLLTEPATIILSRHHFRQRRRRRRCEICRFATRCLY